MATYTHNGIFITILLLIVMLATLQHHYNEQYSPPSEQFTPQQQFQHHQQHHLDFTVQQTNTNKKYIPPKGGKCIPLKPWRFELLALGWQEPVCYQILQSNGITHYWANLDDIPYHNATGTCATDTQLVYDMPIAQLTNIFTTTQPSINCQQVLVNTLCLTHFRPCDPKIDVGDEYITF